MLDTGRHIILLDPPDQRQRHRLRQIRILAHVFKITPAQRVSLDIDPRCQDHILTPSARFLAQHLTALISKLRIPGRRQRGIAGIVCDIIVSFAHRDPAVIRELHPDAHRTVRSHHPRNPQPLHTFGTEKSAAVDHIDFFF